MDDNTSLALVLVNYYNDDEVFFFIEHEIKKQQTQPSVIAVVNNGSHDVNRLKTFCTIHPGIIFLDLGKNLGYLGAFLFAFARLKDLNPKWIILSNTDIQFSSEFFLKDLLAKNYSDDFVVIGPSIISSRTNHNQNPIYKDRIPLSKLKMLSFVFSNYISYFIYQLSGLIKSKLKSFSPSSLSKEVLPVYAVHGSFMFIRTSFIEKYYDEMEKTPFLFGEEIALAEVALKNDKRIVFDPSLTIIHREHSTTGLFSSIKTVRQLKRSIDTLIENRSK